jgi:hypothetical protein
MQSLFISGTPSGEEFVAPGAARLMNLQTVAPTGGRREDT